MQFYLTGGPESMKDKKHNTLLILSPHAATYADIIQAAGLMDLTMYPFETIKDASSRAKDANILLGEPELLQKTLPAADRLEWAQSTWAGVAPLTGQDCRKDYQLTCVKDVFGPIMAEYVLCYMLMHERKVLQCYALQQAKQWKMPTPGLLRGKRAGVLGAGSIGVAIAKAAKFFNMQTRGFCRTPSPREHIDQMFGPDQLLEFARDLDYLIAVLPATPHTTQLIDTSVFRAMKPEAVFINVGRGNVVDEYSLVDALHNKEIASAVLDVFQQEPLPQSHPFWQTERLIITSHKAAFSSPKDIAPLFIDNYRRFAAGKPLKHLVDFMRGY